MYATITFLVGLGLILGPLLERYAAKRLGTGSGSHSLYYWGPALVVFAFGLISLLFNMKDGAAASNKSDAILAAVTRQGTLSMAALLSPCPSSSLASASV